VYDCSSYAGSNTVLF
nr:immunoglobulin light chain junction region [Macaca mulatta]